MCSRHSRRIEPIALSQIEFAFGLRYGVLSARNPTFSSKPSNSFENTLPLSWITNRYLWSDGIACRSYCMVHSDVGCEVALQYKIRLDPCSKMTNT